MASHPDKPARHICFKKIKVLFKFAWMMCNGNASGSRGGSCKSFIALKEMSINQLWFSSKHQHAEGETGRVGIGP